MTVFSCFVLAFRRQPKVFWSLFSGFSSSGTKEEDEAEIFYKLFLFVVTTQVCKAIFMPNDAAGSSVSFRHILPAPFIIFQKVNISIDHHI